MRKNFFQSMKEIFRDWDLKVMSYVMLVVTATCVITATVAWFTFSVSASVQNMEIKTGDAEIIKVAVVTEGEDVDTIRATGKEPEATITMPVFTGVTQTEENTKVLAPGTYGSVTLYITPLKTDITACKILPSFFGSDGEEYGLTYLNQDLTDDEKLVIEQLVRGHILFFSEYDEETKEYSGLITEDSPVQYKLNKNVENQITIYWYWPYEYEDLPNGVEKWLSFEDDYMLFDPEKSEDEYTKSRRYDFADTKIGSNVESVKFHFEVSAVYGSSN